MFPVFLTKVKTRDGLFLDGICVKPKRKSATAIIWLHGLSSRFSSGQALIKELSLLCGRNGIGYFKFNNRGHDIATRGTRGLAGSGFEKFSDCVLDIKAMIGLVRKLGYRNIILAGHSTGANKALYYLYKTKDRRVKGLMLLGSLSDVVVGFKGGGLKERNKALAIAKKLKDKKQEQLMPLKYGLYTARRYWSLYHPGEAEDVFPYYNFRAGWKELKSVKVPLAVIIGSRDEHLDRPAGDLIRIFSEKAKSAENFSGIVIKNANHGFLKKEKQLSRTIVNWIKKM